MERLIHHQQAAWDALATEHDALFASILAELTSDASVEAIALQLEACLLQNRSTYGLGSHTTVYVTAAARLGALFKSHKDLIRFAAPHFAKDAVGASSSDWKDIVFLMYRQHPLALDALRRLQEHFSGLRVTMRGIDWTDRENPQLTFVVQGDVPLPRMWDVIGAT